MSLKDRIAVVASLLWIVVVFSISLPHIRGSELISIIVPVMLYWGYRFVINDLSFLKQK
ncbi:hypothetical protein [Hydrogenimonas sp.]